MASTAVELMRRRFGGKKGGLPSGYEQLEYITTGDSTYFLTGFVPTTGCKVEVTIKGTATTSQKAGALFGSRSGWNNKSFYLRCGVSSGSATNMTALCGYSSERSVSVNINASDKNVFGVDNGTFYINDTILGTYTDVFSPIYELYLLMVNNAGSPQTSVISPIGNLYGAKIWDDNGNLVRDYVPAKRLADNAEGIYDLVNNTFQAK